MALNKVGMNGICCFSVKYTKLRRKDKDWWAQNQEKGSE
jgi:hypothetical protein